MCQKFRNSGIMKLLEFIYIKTETETGSTKLWERNNNTLLDFNRGGLSALLY